MRLEEIIKNHLGTCRICEKPHSIKIKNWWFWRTWLWFSRKVLKMSDEEILGVFLKKVK